MKWLCFHAGLFRGFDFCAEETPVLSWHWRCSLFSGVCGFQPLSPWTNPGWLQGRHSRTCHMGGEAAALCEETCALATELNLWVDPWQPPPAHCHVCLGGDAKNAPLNTSAFKGQKSSAQPKEQTRALGSACLCPCGDGRVWGLCCSVRPLVLNVWIYWINSLKKGSWGHQPNLTDVGRFCNCLGQFQGNIWKWRCFLWSRICHLN